MFSVGRWQRSQTSRFAYRFQNKKARNFFTSGQGLRRETSRRRAPVTINTGSCLVGLFAYLYSLHPIRNRDGAEDTLGIGLLLNQLDD
jgi:hypothetical protein